MLSFCDLFSWTRWNMLRQGRYATKNCALFQFELLFSALKLCK